MNTLGCEINLPMTTPDHATCLDDELFNIQSQPPFRQSDCLSVDGLPPSAPHLPAATDHMPPRDDAGQAKVDARARESMQHICQYHGDEGVFDATASPFKRRVQGLHRLLTKGLHSVRLAYDDAAHNPLPAALTSALHQCATATIDEGGVLVNILMMAERALADGEVGLSALLRENIDDAKKNKNNNPPKTTSSISASQR